jgi:DNA-binding NarL/FixJ family response regulator
MTLRVLLVDDHELMREGLRSILAREPDVEVVGEAADGRAALQLARTLTPDIVIMDVAMQDQNGIEATRQIRSSCPDVKVLALSSHSDPRYVTAMLDAGACGYVLKANAYDDLRRALDAARRGRSYLCADVTDAVVSSSMHGGSAVQAAAQAHWEDARRTGKTPGTLGRRQAHWENARHTGKTPGALGRRQAHWENARRTGKTPGALKRRQAH